MPPIDERDGRLIEVACNVIAGLILAHRRGDVAAITAELGRLLVAVSRYSNALDERPSDAPLRAAIARLNGEAARY